MWAFIFSFLKKYWLQLLFVLIPLGFVGVFVWKWNNMKETITKQKQVIFQQEQTIKILENNIDKLTNSMQKVNQSLQVISKTSEEVKQQFTNLTNNVNKQVGGLNVRLENILKQPKPSTCEKAIEYLIDAKQDYRNSQERINIKNNNNEERIP